MAALSFPLCIVLFGINDVYDYPSDLVNPRKSGTLAEGIVLPPAYHGFVIRAGIVSSAITISASCLPYISAASAARTWQAGILAVSTAALIAFAWMYSAPPFRLKERPMMDSLSNALMVWLAWFIGFTSSSTLTGVMRGLEDVPLEVNMLTLVATGVHALGAAADIEADESAGYKTVATVLGRQLCAVYGAMVYAVALSTEMRLTVIGVYFLGGLCTMVSVCVWPSPARVHRGFQITFFGTMVMGALWVVTGMKDMEIK
ncbi:hypothetical protein FRC12_007617 [Ceratobasidium sp. 428]|nr:hypothetical protein FRC12_007617 [Ceratobasidium sp. 428]